MSNSLSLSLQDYLKKTSSISTAFIDDFFSLYDRNTTSTDFVIDLDVISKWLLSKKYHLKDTLKSTYTQDIDYIVKTEKSTGGRPNEKILLTGDCFKRLCMLSRTKKAEDVRSYFIDLEKHIDKYKNHIMEGLVRKVEMYEKELKPQPKQPSKGVIYVLKMNNTDGEVYRIGKTNDFNKRMSVYKTANPKQIETVFMYETDMINEIEKCLRLMLEGTNYRKNRDFYEVDLNVIKNLIRECECMKINVKHNGKNIKDEECRYFIRIWKSNLKNKTKTTTKTTKKTKINKKSSEKQTKNKKKTTYLNNIV
jgi:phage anti-repressor protein